MCGYLMPICPVLFVAQHDMEPVGEIIFDHQQSSSHRHLHCGEKTFKMYEKIES